MYDIIFLSYKEINADKNYQTLLERFPLSKRVNGVTGILEAHQKAASIAETGFFWVIDADNIIKEEFDFSFTWKPQEAAREPVAVWRAVNAVNGLTYGYGGIKLLPRCRVLSMIGPIVDFTTTINPENFVIKNEVASVTEFNTSPFDAWKGGFREAVKLTSAIISKSKKEENMERLNTWLQVGSDKPFGEYVLRGAFEGCTYGNNNIKNPKALKKINNWKWLKQVFENGL